MPALESHVEPDSPEFQENLAHMGALLADLRRRLAEARAGGGEEAVRRHREQGKLLVRDRIERLLDPGTPFLEIAALAAHRMYDRAAPSAGMGTRIRRARGRGGTGGGDDAPLKGGTHFPLTAQKHPRGPEIAHEEQLPCGHH